MPDFGFRVEEKDLDSLAPLDGNPRTIIDESLDGLERCILKYGLVQPIVWNERTGHIVGGHQRLKVLRRNGAARTQVVVVDLPIDDERSLAVALNNEKLQGRWTDGLSAFLASIGDGKAIEGLMTDELVESLGGHDEGVVRPVNVSRPPRMVWTVVAVPEDKAGEATPYIDRLSRIEGAFVESVKR
jgi:hypothetical protein